MSRGYTSAGTESDTAEDGFTSADSDTSDPTLVNLKKPRGCTPPITAGCCCHICYVVQFLTFMVIFPLWAKWLVTNPMPEQYWHESYGKWPAISAPDGDQLALESPNQYPIKMSAIPDTPDSCNYSCSAWRGYRTAEMNFRVSLTLNDSALAKGYAHTVYPVLMASADFQDWWVVADRRHAFPTPFWGAKTAKSGHAYSKDTDACTRPPATSEQTTEAFSGTYVLACVVWSPTQFAKLEQQDAIAEADLSQVCNSVGGVCGWSCDSRVDAERLEGCSADGTINVTETSIAGVELGGASFQGEVSMQECADGSVTGKCEPTTAQFNRWTCHDCKYDPTAIEDDERRLQLIPGMAPPPGLEDTPDTPLVPVPGSAGSTGTTASKSALIYTSLPRFKVTVSGVTVPSGTDVFSQPRTFILTSSTATKGVWKKLYQAQTATIPAPFPVDASGKAIIKTSSDDESRPLLDAVSRQAMSLEQLNTLDIEPDWCYGMQGPMYLVACAVNSTVYANGFDRFKPGQHAAPPPFNDRCMAVSGRCGHACQSSQAEMANCTADGHIIQSKLLGAILADKNQSTPVWLFVYVLLIGFGVKVVMLCPGIFSPYPHCRRYDPFLTEALRYIVVCVPSAGENKNTVLRNVVGAIGCMPKDCKCRYHVAFVDEGHRHEQKVMFGKLGDLVAAIPNFGGNSYEENVRQFFLMWVAETKQMDLQKLKDGYKGDVDADIMERMSGRLPLKKLKKENGWHAMPAGSLSALDQAIDALEEDLKNLKKEKKDIHRDDVADWEPKERNSLALRLHYLSRAKPQEDERTIKAQHVAPGTWYYRVPQNAENKDWLRLRQGAKEMVYGLEDDDPFMNNVPLRTSRGKAGGLNFVENYLSIYADAPKNLYGDDRDNAPCLFSICDARHQFQTDFFHTTIPYFFSEDQELNPYVAFTQCPQFFHEMQDKLDYLDNNNAQFFRLNCMVRNCCGGVSSCGTNGTWMIRHPEGDMVWEREKRRVRDTDSKRKSKEYVERRTFHESCKVEDTASSLQQVLKGRRSQFINRRLSYGMAKNPVDYLAAVQRWAEGGVVLSMQTFLSYHKGVYMVWFTFIFFLSFLFSLYRMVSATDTHFILVELGVVDKSMFEKLMAPVIEWLHDQYWVTNSEYFQRHPQLLADYVTMTTQFMIWVATLVLFLVLVFVVTELLKVIQRVCGLKMPCIWPDEMRWWGRLLISMDNLTYFLWFWTAFFWIGFNYYSVFAKRSYHFSSVGMFSFMLAIQILSWGMIIASSMRYTLSTSMEANEVISLSMDNIWRSTQLFYITAPLLFYSIIKGVQDYLRYQMYGEDISYWVGGDRGAMSTNLVKYWTLLLLIGAVSAWVYYIVAGHNEVGAFGSCLIVSLIALDVLHPCAYLWVGQTKTSDAMVSEMTWSQAFATRGFYERKINNLVLNQTVTGLFKWLGPAWFVLMPLLTLVMPYIGVNQAFMMVGSTTNR